MRLGGLLGHDECYGVWRFWILLHFVDLFEYTVDWVGLRLLGSSLNLSVALLS